MVWYLGNWCVYFFFYYSFGELKRAFYSALLFYEYVITADGEVNVVWMQPWNTTSILLLSIRWVMLFVVVLNLVPSSPGVCDH